MATGAVERNPSEYAEIANRPDRPVTQTLSEAEAASRLDEIHQYLKDRYARRDVVTQTVTKGGVQLDWVPVESQMVDGRIAEPPGEDRPLKAEKGEFPAEPVHFELEDEAADRGPRGTVPLVRLPVERIKPTSTLADWLSKGPATRIVAPLGSGRETVQAAVATVHKYGYSSQSVTCYGTAGNINAWNTYVERSDEFSLGQLSLSRGSGTGRQTLEVGHQTYKDLYGDWVPHLFTFYTTNGYTQSGDNKGGYNENVKGWVQYSSTVHPGALSSPLSTFGGTQYVLGLKVQLWQGNWWVRVNGNWIGYYPASLYATTGLRDQASAVSWFGEVVDSGTDPATTQTDMGSGHWPYEGFGYCAYMNNLEYQSDTGGTMTRYSGSTWASHPNCYTVEGHFSNTGSWESYQWWGGSGRNSACP
ncbi:neprosin family prolyl endopeptidase [Streptomyces sp. TLI_185]|uniref:neprosin family prolyl endopeptidase n=1 Tax=Streptomyces sp. TLI_185 TaxID=2485151 RepID=UPI000F4F3E9F|nr:neprosin family prolyl endopeptidase [Streptomyces sp. TLI_185]RPF24754.1 uncharacterized protein DUF239 [Streptomyces sp. TLI_185]